MMGFKLTTWDIPSRLARVQPQHHNRYQCPYSKCFHAIYERSDLPCARSSFEDYSKLNEHVLKYHAEKDSGSRPTNERLREEDQEDLVELEEDANIACHGKRKEEENLPKPSEISPNKRKRGKNPPRPSKGNSNRPKKETPPSTQTFPHKMTPEKTNQFRAWKEHPRTRQLGKEERYWAMCRFIFDLEDDTMFAGQTPFYDYLLLGQPSWSLEDQLAQWLNVPAQNLQADPLMLDNDGFRPAGSWAMTHGPLTNDSGYVSLPTNSASGDQATQSSGSQPQFSFPSPVFDIKSDGVSGAHPSLGNVYLSCIPDEDCQDSAGASG